MLTSHQIYDRLLDGYGPVQWWPGDEYAIMVTAVLVQNTSWTNVEKTVAELGERLNPEFIDSLTEDELQPLIRSCGFYKAKSRYVKELTAWFKDYGFDAAKAARKPMPELRKELLSLRGVGAETADSILTYALRLPSFVLDAYTRRLLERLGFAFRTDDERRAFLTDGIEHSADMYGWYHWLILDQCKTRCGKRTKCEGCVFGDVCRR